MAERCIWVQLGLGFPGGELCRRSGHRCVRHNRQDYSKHDLPRLLEEECGVGVDYMSKLEIMKQWIVSHWKELIAGISIFFGAIAIWLSRNNRINNPKIAIRVQKDAKEIARKEVLAELYEKEAHEKGFELIVLQNEVAESKAKVVEIMHGPNVKEMTDEEIAALYAKSGL